MFQCDTVEQWMNSKPVGEQQANDIAGIIHDYTDLLDGVRPVIEFSHRTVRSRRAFCHNCPKDQKFGRIVVHRNGENFGTLAHELAHLAPGAQGQWHTPAWAEACVTIRKEMADFARRATIVY